MSIRTRHTDTLPVRARRPREAAAAPARRVVGLALTLLLVCLPAYPAAATVTVQVAGRVAHAGRQALPDGARISDAVNAAQVRPDAYIAGAAWLRPSLRNAQVRLKAGLLYEVGVLEGQARLDGNTALTQLAAALQRRWRGMPVTGRQTGALLDPRPVEASDRNHRLADGDRIIYPARPRSVRVAGAVRQPCRLRFVPLRDARLYLGDCALAAAADRDWLYVIQPDGHISRHGIALWNRGPPQALAPGAVLYVPVDPRHLPPSIRAGMNVDAVNFIATQLLPGVRP